jgi:predicted PurR-regulated permease PerM
MGPIKAGVFASFAVVLAILIFVFATGQTFGQRCERLFPHDPAFQERCVHRLAYGEQP